MRTNFDMKEKVMKVSKSGGNLDAKKCTVQRKLRKIENYCLRFVKHKKTIQLCFFIRRFDKTLQVTFLKKLTLEQINKSSFPEPTLMIAWNFLHG